MSDCPYCAPDEPCALHQFALDHPSEEALAVIAVMEETACIRNRIIEMAQKIMIEAKGLEAKNLDLQARVELLEEELRLREQSQIPVIPRAAQERLDAAEARVEELETALKWIRGLAQNKLAFHTAFRHIYRRAEEALAASPPLPTDKDTE